MQELEDEEQEEAYSLHLIEARKEKVPPMKTTIFVEEVPLCMEIDTGASVSLISEATFKNELGRQPPIQPAVTQLRTYSGQRVPVLGRINVRVRAEKIEKYLPLLVVKGRGSDLIGRDWLTELSLNWTNVKQVRQSSEHPQLQQLLEKFADVFKPELGEYSGPKVSLPLRPNARPRFLKARNVPFALKEKVEKQLEKEIEQGILKSVSSSAFASPIVPVLKTDGSIRICADFKQTVNPAVMPDTYPLPRIEELFTKLTGGKLFSKLDLSQAYSQLPLDEAAQQLCTVNTSKGLLRYTRLPFGVAPAVGIFQRLMDGLLQGVPNVACFIDDLIITGTDEDNHLQSLERVLQRLQQCGLRCGLNKCRFMEDSVTYLGHKIDAAGLHPLPDKVDAIVRAPAPRNVTQLRSFLGLVNYYSKCLPRLSDELAPLHRLLVRDARWHWGKEQDAAFCRCKTLLSRSPVLAHYDKDKPLLLECDASPYGVGAVICHSENGVNRPIAFASRSLHPAEAKYSQLEKEALAIVFGVKKFHAYLYGRDFTLISDHKPLLGLLHETKAIPALASGRIQRWALLLAGYSYRMQHRSGSSLLCADALSRLPLPERPCAAPTPAEVVLMMEQLDEGPVTSAQVRAWTRRDKNLSRVVRFLETGRWPDSVPPELQPYSSRAEQLSLQDGCVLWGSRVLVPPPGREALLQCLHQGHQGASRMKTLARGYFWWPRLDFDIEQLARRCGNCLELQRSPAPFPLQPWPWPDKPWSRIYIDYAGPIEGKMLLLLVDAHSKWIDAHVTSSSSSEVTIRKLTQSFATHGVPEILVSDNGPNLVSNEMEAFFDKERRETRSINPI